jgi:hypothetical protein
MMSMKKHAMSVTLFLGTMFIFSSAYADDKSINFRLRAAIDLGDYIDFNVCIKKFDVNSQWGEVKDTPLMHAIKKLVNEKRNHQGIYHESLKVGIGFAALSGCGYLVKAKGGPIISNWATFIQQQTAAHQKSITQEVAIEQKDDQVLSVKNVALALTAAAGVYFMVTTFYKYAKSLVSTIWKTYQINSSRLLIVEQLINDPKIDFMVRNNEKSEQFPDGKTVLDIIQELRANPESGMQEILKELEKQIVKKMETKVANINGQTIDESVTSAPVEQSEEKKEDSVAPETREVSVPEVAV